MNSMRNSQSGCYTTRRGGRLDHANMSQLISFYLQPNDAEGVVDTLRAYKEVSISIFLAHLVIIATYLQHTAADHTDMIAIYSNCLSLCATLTYMGTLEALYCGES